MKAVEIDDPQYLEDKNQYIIKLRGKELDELE